MSHYSSIKKAAIYLLISDNRRGLQQKQRQAENLGLVGMHERMTAIGGTLHIRTSPGCGVIIRVTCYEQTEKASVELRDPRDAEKQAVKEKRRGKGQCAGLLVHPFIN